MSENATPASVGATPISDAYARIARAVHSVDMTALVNMNDIAEALEDLARSIRSEDSGK